MAIAGSGKLAAVGAIVIGSNQECSIRINRLAVEGQVFDAFRLRVNGLTLTVVFRRLRYVNLILHAVNHVEVIGAETVPVDQRLRLAAFGINLVKLSGGTLQPLFHLFARRFHHDQRVGIKIQIRRVAEGELTFFHFDVAGRIVLTSADFERCGSRKNRQFCQIRIALNEVLNVSFLRHVDDLHGRIVLHQRQVAVHVVGRFSDRLTDKLTRSVMVVLEHVHQIFIFCGQRFFSCRIVNRASLGFRLRHLPFSGVVVQHQIDYAQMIAPHARHH